MSNEQIRPTRSAYCATCTSLTHAGSVGRNVVGRCCDRRTCNMSAVVGSPAECALLCVPSCYHCALSSPRPLPSTLTPLDPPWLPLGSADVGRGRACGGRHGQAAGWPSCWVWRQAWHMHDMLMPTSCRLRTRPRAQAAPPPKTSPRGPGTPRPTARPRCTLVRGGTPPP